MRPPTSREEAGALVITFDDPAGLNDGRSDAFRQALYELVESYPTQPRVAADLSPVDYLSSSGVAVLVGLKRRVDAKQGQLVLCHLHPYVHDVLRVTKLHQLFTIVPDQAMALRQLQAAGPA
jgi:anti-sigma B factor antagonist